MAKPRMDDATGEVQYDYVAEGSPEHIARLMIRKAGKDDLVQHEGWALVDRTAWGPAATNDFLLDILRQKVNQLNAPHIPLQSKDPSAPGYAPEMFVPTVGGKPRRTRGIV